MTTDTNHQPPGGCGLPGCTAQECNTAQLDIIKQASTADCEGYLVRYAGQLWVLAFHDDPGLDYAIGPDGTEHTGIWDPFGPYTHPLIPQDLLDQLSDHIADNV